MPGSPSYASSWRYGGVATVAGSIRAGRHGGARIPARVRRAMVAARLAERAVGRGVRICYLTRRVKRPSGGKSAGASAVTKRTGRGESAFWRKGLG